MAAQLALSDLLYFFTTYFKFAAVKLYCWLSGMVTTYSRCFLTSIGAESSNIKLKSTLWRNLCNIGISRVKPIVILPKIILILGDFNLHVNAADDVNSKRFLDLLLSFNLKQHVLCPTYNGRYTPDLMITRSDDLFVSDVCTSDIVISDHSPVLCHLNLVKPLSKTKFVNFRNPKSICLDSFKHDISVSLACVDNSDISKLVSHYHEVLASTLNTHAPLKRRAVTVPVKKAPWYTPEVDFQKKVRRRQEP